MRIILNSGISRAATAAMAVVAAVGVGACSASSRASAGAPGRPRVVAAEDFWGSIAEQIAGADATVSSIVTNPDTDPHDYEATPDDARAVASADLVIENGIGYDPWVQKLIDVEGTSGRRVLDVGRVLDVPGGDNPHQWYSQAAVETFIDRVTSDLAAIDPAHRADYERRKHDFRSRGLADYTALVAQIKEQFGGTPIGGSESIVALWARSLGLDMVTPESFVDAVAEGSEPTASDKATADAQIREHKVKVFVFNSQNTTPDVQRLVDDARRAGIPVTTVTETLVPEHASFQAWQVRQLRALLAALQQADRA